jgi:uncharacterized protein (DUF486 family)
MIRRFAFAKWARNDESVVTVQRFLSARTAAAMKTVLLLILSNLFMTLAWYGHLRFPRVHLLLTILISWLIALPEYALQVPANRIGYRQFSAAQLKIIQEVISISVFVVFSLLYLQERPSWRMGVAFLLIVGAVALVVQEGNPHARG